MYRNQQYALTHKDTQKLGTGLNKIGTHPLYPLKALNGVLSAYQLLESM